MLLAAGKPGISGTIYNFPAKTPGLSNGDHVVVNPNRRCVHVAAVLNKTSESSSFEAVAKDSSNGSTSRGDKGINVRAVITVRKKMKEKINEKIRLEMGLVFREGESPYDK